MLAGVTPRSFGVLGLTFQFPGVLRPRLPGVLTFADQASTAAGGDDRFCGSPVQARPGGGSGVVVVPTLAALVILCEAGGYQSCLGRTIASFYLRRCNGETKR